MTEKNTVNVNVKTNLIKQIRTQNPEFADMPATHIVDFILRTWLVGDALHFHKTGWETKRK